MNLALAATALLSCSELLTGIDVPSAPGFKPRFEACGHYLKKHYPKDAFEERVRDLDACRPDAKGWAESAIQPLKTPAQDEAKGKEAKRILSTRFQELLARTTDACCGQDKTCREAVSATRMQWCTPPDDPNSVAPCKEGGVFTQMSDASWKTWQSQRESLLTKKPSLQLKQVSVPQYEIFVSQRFDASSGAPLTHPRILAHELGHVCVNVQNVLKIRGGSRDSFQLLNDLGWAKTPAGDTDRCKPPPAHRRAWHSLASQLKMSAATESCLADLAALTPKARFAGEAKPCPWPCVNDVWNEALVDWIHFEILPREYWFPHLFPDYCTSRRDGSHALPADQLSCFLLTPAFKSRLVQGLGCKI